MSNPRETTPAGTAFQAVLRLHGGPLKLFVIKIDEDDDCSETIPVFWTREGAEVELAKRRWLDYTNKGLIGQHSEVSEALEEGKERGFGTPSWEEFSVGLAQLFNAAWDTCELGLETDNHSEIQHIEVRL